MDLNLNNLSDVRIIPKPWGQETIYTPEELKYTFKQIQINDGARLSLQSHDEKVETFVLIEGQADLIIGPDMEHLKTVHMEKKIGYNIPVGIIHRMIGVKNAIILEASTPETGTTFRYQDDYHRPDETPIIRQEKNRGWNPNQ